MPVVSMPLTMMSVMRPMLLHSLVGILVNTLRGTMRSLTLATLGSTNKCNPQYQCHYYFTHNTIIKRSLPLKIYRPAKISKTVGIIIYIIIRPICVQIWTTDCSRGTVGTIAVMNFKIYVQRTLLNTQLSKVQEYVLAKPGRNSVPTYPCRYTSIVFNVYFVNID